MGLNKTYSDAASLSPVPSDDCDYIKDIRNEASYSGKLLLELSLYTARELSKKFRVSMSFAISYGQIHLHISNTWSWQYTFIFRIEDNFFEVFDGLESVKPIISLDIADPGFNDKNIIDLLGKILERS